MTREELKGKQTPGDWIVDARATAHIRTDDRSVASAATHWTNMRDVSEENDANAALIAEAGTVANRTGMWPEDMEARIKELEETLSDAADTIMAQAVGYYENSNREDAENIRYILNKRR